MKRRTIAVAAAAILLPLCALTLFTPTYRTNDDVAMRLMAEGRFVPGSEPLPWLLFINVIVGKILATAYTFAPQIPWYDLLLGAMTVVGAAVLFDTWCGSGRWLDIAWACLFAVFFLLPILVRVQFSLAAMTCAAAGVALLARGKLPLGIALFVAGSLVRFEGAVLIALLGVALAIPIVKERGRAVIAGAAIALTLAVIGFAVNLLAYRQTTGWSTFYEFNLHRSRLSEYLDPERVPPDGWNRLARETGWSRNDFQMLQNWFFIDPDVFSLQKVRDADRLLHDAQQRGEPSATFTFFKSTWLVFALFTAFVVSRGAAPRLLFYLLATTLILALFIAFIAFVSKAPPPRIFWPMLILAAAAIAIAAPRWERPVPRAVSIVALALGVTITIVQTRAVAIDAATHRDAIEGMRADVEGLQRTGANLFVLHAYHFPFEDYWLPLHPQPTPPFPFIALGASARTPPVEDFLKRTGRADLLTSLCSDPSLLLVTAPPTLPMLVTFMREHHGMNVQFTPLFTGKRTQAWRCGRV